MLKKLITPIWMYLKDWKNLLSHTLVGILILAVGFYLPVPTVTRIHILVAIVAFNLFRMRLSDKKNQSIV